MKENNRKSSDGNQNSNNNAESNNVYRLIEKTAEQLTASASRYNERAECGQVITFERAEQKKAVGTAANADSEGYLAGIFWSGFVTLSDGTRHDFSRLDSNGIARKFAGVCSWKRATRGTLLDGNATRTAEQRAEDAKGALCSTREKASENSVMFVIFEKIESDDNLKNDILQMIVERMEKADAAAAEKASAKESKTAQRERELQEAKAAAEAATNATDAAIKLLLATGQYKTEEDVRKALGL